MCSSIPPLFGIEKEAKDFRGSDAAAKAWLRGGFCPKHGLSTSITFTSVTALLLRYVHVAYGKIAARQARGYGVLYEVKPVRHKCCFSYTQTVNRTRFSDQLACAR